MSTPIRPGDDSGQSGPPTHGYGSQPWTGSQPASPSQPWTGSQPATGSQPWTGSQPTAGSQPWTGAQQSYDSPSWQQPPTQQPWSQQPEAPKKRSPWVWIAPLAALLVAALVVTLLVVGGDPGVKDGDREIKNASSFASSQAKTWKSALPKKGINLSDDAGCFYLADKDSEEVTKKLACGPVRRPQTSESEVWDLYTYEVNPSGKDTATAENPSDQPEQAQKLPAGTILIDGDGAESDVDGSGLKEPEIPRLDADSVIATGDYEVAPEDAGEAMSQPGENSITGLGTEFGVSSITEYKQAIVDGAISRAAHDQKLYVVAVEQSYAANNLSGTNEAALKVGDNEVAIDSSGNGQYLISAGDDTDLKLTVVSEGKTQTLDLRTGQRSGDPGTEALYGSSIEKSSSPGTKIDVPPATGPDGTSYDVIITVDTVTTAPYKDGSGWAPDGQVFLTIDLSSEGTTSSTAAAYFNLDCAATTINEGTATCDPGPFGTATVTGTATAGGAVTLNFAGQLLISSTPTTASGTTPVPFTTTSASVPLPA